MAKQTSIFQFEGRLGEITGYRDMRGNQIARKIVKASNPQTTLQVAQRTRFLTATGAAAGLKNAIAGLEPTAKSKRLTPRNTLVQMLLTNPDVIKTTTRAIQGDGQISYVTEASIDPKFLQLSRGMLEVPNVTASVEGNILKLKVDDDTIYDYFHLVYFDRYSNRAVPVLIPVEEHGGDVTLTLNIPSSFRGNKAAIYIYGQAIGNNLSRALYQSIWNGNSVQAKATRRTIEADAEYSETAFLGEFEIAA